MSRWHPSRGRKRGTMKSPKKEIEEEDDDFLEDLVVDTNPKEAKETDNLLEPETWWFHHEGRRSQR